MKPEPTGKRFHLPLAYLRAFIIVLVVARVKSD